MAIRAQWTWTSGTSNFWQASGMASFKAIWPRERFNIILVLTFCHATFTHYRIGIAMQETTLIGQWIPLLRISLVETLQRKRAAIQLCPDRRSPSYMQITDGLGLRCYLVVFLGTKYVCCILGPPYHDRGNKYVRSGRSVPIPGVFGQSKGIFW